MNNVLVSVICLTYNHEKYIADAMEGCLAQRVDFKYEIIVHDDASTDGTADIIRQYEAKYPEIVKGIYGTENLYSQNCFIKRLQGRILAKATGKYIMWCEGDDYWIDPTKMQRQIDYLEQNPDCAMIVHNAAVLDMNNVIIKAQSQYWKDKNLSPEEVINHPYGYIGSASMAYRREDYELKGLFKEAEIGDYTTQLYCLTKGRIYYLDRIMSVYRFGQMGSWQNSQMENENIRFRHCVNMIRFLDKYDDYTNYEFAQFINEEIYKYIDVAASANIKKECIYSDANKLSRTDTDCKEYVDEILRLYMQINDERYCGKYTREFTAKYKYVLIMGVGKYASILYRQLAYNKLLVDGFVISPDRKAEELFFNKPVYKLDKLPYKKEEVGILVGINAVSWEIIETILLKEGMKNYYCPYMLMRKCKNVP